MKSGGLWLNISTKKKAEIIKLYACSTIVAVGLVIFIYTACKELYWITVFFTEETN